MLRLICDLDNTLIDTRARVDEIEEEYGIDNWPIEAIEKFCEPDKIINDKLIHNGVIIISNIIKKFHASIHFSTGRSEMSRVYTLTYLNKKLSKIFNMTFANKDLLMRSNNAPDLSPREVKKKNLLSLKISPTDTILFFDDDPSCITMYAKYGLSFKAPECWDDISITL